MDRLTLREIQQVELGILAAFAEYCGNNGLRYSLGGGSLLGAIRHKGFIPWDDDIDVMMPRPDYDKFVQGFNGFSKRYRLYAHETTSDYYHLMSKISDASTVIDEAVGYGPRGMGVNIDVFPIDGLGASYKEAVRAFNDTAFDRELLVASGWKRFSRSKTHGLVYEPARLALYLLSRIADKEMLIERIEAKNRRKNFEDSLFAGCVCGSYRRAEIMGVDTFKYYESVEFEGIKLKAISNYDEYLTKHYGDYMQLPPDEKQVTHHTFDAYWADVRGELH